MQSPDNIYVILSCERAPTPLFTLLLAPFCCVVLRLRKKQALSNSLAQMELRMSGRHSTKIPKTASIIKKTDKRLHRRTRSALSTSRAVDEAAAVVARGLLTGGGGGGGGGRGRRREEKNTSRKVSSPPPPIMWKLSPPPPMLPALSPPPEADLFDGPSPYNGGAGGRGKRQFEGYFPADSTPAAAAVPSSDSFTCSSSPVPDSGADGGADSDGGDDDGDMIFAFDDL